MTQCWPEGALRAYLDSELPPRDMQAVAAHLAGCPACARLHQDLSARAALWDSLQPALDIPQPVRAPSRTASWRWTAAAVAVAAGLAIATVLIPRPQPKQPPAPAITPVAVQPPPEAPDAAPVITAPAPLRARTASARKPRRAPLPEPFLALDDEPIESGIVMRVTVPGSTPADIVFSPDGRARAIRLVSGTQQNY